VDNRFTGPRTVQRLQAEACSWGLPDLGSDETWALEQRTDVQEVSAARAPFVRVLPIESFFALAAFVYRAPPVKPRQAFQGGVFSG